jgi:hypothetical protein
MELGVMIKKINNIQFTERQLREAAVVLGAASWQARVEKVGLPRLREQFSTFGKLGGRPRKETKAL